MSKKIMKNQSTRREFLSSALKTGSGLGIAIIASSSFPAMARADLEPNPDVSVGVCSCKSSCDCRKNCVGYTLPQSSAPDPDKSGTASGASNDARDWAKNNTAGHGVSYDSITGIYTCTVNRVYTTNPAN